MANKFIAGLVSQYNFVTEWAGETWKALWERKEAYSINEVLQDERAEIEKSRKGRAADLNCAKEIEAVRDRFLERDAIKAIAADAGGEGAPANYEKVVQDEKVERGRPLLEPLGNEAKNDLVGLCFSGGGIRSATFNLGVTTGIAKNGYLHQIDYLSTVSGGGYIGSWLTAWIKRDGCDEAQEKLRKETVTADGRYLEPDPVRFLRKYSNYLAPRTGLMSTDLWALLAVYLRNVTLNLALLVASGAVILLIPLFGVQYGWTLARMDLQGIVLTLTRVLLVIAMGAIAYSFASFSRNVEPKLKVARSIVNRPGPWIVAPLLLAAILMTYVLTPDFGDKLKFVLGASFSPPIKNGPETGWIATHLLGWISTTAWYRWLSALPAKSGHPEMTNWIILGAVWYTAIWVLGNFAARFFEVFSGWHDEVLKSNKTPGKIKLFWLALRQLKWRTLFGGGQGPKPISKSVSVSFMAALLAGTLGGLLLYGVGQLLTNLPGALWQALGHRPEVVQIYAKLALWIILGPPLLLWTVALVSALHVGLLGRSFPDAKREWLARLCALLALVGVAWAVGTGLALYGSVVFEFLFLSTWANTTWGAILKWLVASGWFAATAAGIIGGNRSKAKPQGGNGSIGKLLKLAPPVFVLGLLLLLSWGVDRYLRSSPLDDNGATSGEPTVLQYKGMISRASAAGSVGDFVQHFTELVKAITPPDARAAMDEVGKAHWLYAGRYLNPGSRSVRNLLIALIAIMLLLSWRLDVNEFSIHLLYRNRLVRCYLGASRKKREPQPFTGFDVDDDLPLASLRVEAEKLDANGNPDLKKPYYGPYHLVCAALNLVSGKELAWQTRKARSFLYSPLYCGYDYYDPSGSSSRPAAGVTEPALNAGGAVSTQGKRLAANAYRPTEFFSGSPGPYLGTALAISGAAASPNMGYHSSPALTFLMGVFNVRLGWWAGNPRNKRTWRLFGPRSAFYLGFELMGRTDDEKAFVYLSDGGHFENLGLYELVRRKCRYIIASDGSSDLSYSFSDLGNAIQKCRRDLGAEILIDLSKLRPKADTRMSESHYAFGKIRYCDGTEGTLLYLKSSLKQTDRQDVQSFAREDGEFPHDTTADQFFNETRFESYRALGEDAFQSVVADVTEKMEERGATGIFTPLTVAGLFTALEQIYSKATPARKSSFDLQEVQVAKMKFSFETE